MVDHNEILEFIKETGYRTLEEVKARFKAGSKEILDANMEFLSSKGMVRHVKVGDPVNDTLYYIPE